jgi:hypothetical protein
MSCSSKSAASRSAFSRLSAGSVARGGLEPPGFNRLAESGARGACCSEEWHTWSLKSLEGVVSAIHETREVVDKVRSAFEEVRGENVTAAQADAAHVLSLSETSSTWCWLRRGNKSAPSKPSGPGELTATQRLLG